MHMFLTFNAGLLLTNFFKADTPCALAFRLDPAVVLRDRPAALYPEKPYGIYLVCGRDFCGFHVRFRDVARGGVKLVMSRDVSHYERNYATLFDECYNLAYAQQNKNKDIPEGGAKGLILPDSMWPTSGGGNASGNMLAGSTLQSPAATKCCFTKYFGALLECMMPEKNGIFAGHMKGQTELLYFGPCENTEDFMDLGAELAKDSGHPFWRALTTGKSLRLGGVPHATYGVVTCSIRTYVTELLRVLGEREEDITKFQTGGPDGELGSNEILASKDKTIGIVDASGVVYDPQGLNRTELMRLAVRRLRVKHFSRAFLGEGAFLVTAEEQDVELPNGTKWRTGADLRDAFHFTDYAAADLFVPCEGQPNFVTTENVQQLFDRDGKCKFRMVVEGANLFFSTSSHAVLERAGVHVFRDSTANKGGVNSSSLEVLAALAMPEKEHERLMCCKAVDGKAPPEFYERFVGETLGIIRENAKHEFAVIWAANQRHGIPKVEAAIRLSSQINTMTDNMMTQLGLLKEEERDRLVHCVLAQSLPALILEHLGVAGVLRKVPANYVSSIVASWVASRYVYRNGIGASEASFYFFMRELMGDLPGSQTDLTASKRPAPNGSDDAGAASSVSGGAGADEVEGRGKRQRVEDAAEAASPEAASWTVEAA